jgi:sterol desaturase/sphingolipid hydroxylase (fatty acid hydroxylase superfamily)
VPHDHLLALFRHTPTNCHRHPLRVSIIIANATTTFHQTDVHALSLLTETNVRFDFPLNPTKFIPFYGGAKFHDYHHRIGEHSQSNFAPTFTYCDYLYGTDKVRSSSDPFSNYLIKS